MQKTYKSKSFLSISVAVGKMTCQDTQDSNKSVTKDVFKHITFEPDTTGYAYYSTADETEQKAIEAHPLFNKMFVLKDAPASTVAKKAAAVPVEKKEVEVTSAADAKQYLVDTFGISRTKIQSTADIKKYAEQNGVVFVGI